MKVSYLVKNSTKVNAHFYDMEKLCHKFIKLLLYCPVFGIFAVKILYILITRPVLQRNAPCKRDVNFAIEPSVFQNRFIIGAHSISDIKFRP